MLHTLDTVLHSSISENIYQHIHTEQKLASVIFTEKTLNCKQVTLHVQYKKKKTFLQHGNHSGILEC